MLGRVLQTLALALALAVCSPNAQVLAQAPPGNGLPGAQGPAEAESTGDPTMGYVGFAILAGLSVFLVSKSSRRSIAK